MANERDNTGRKRAIHSRERQGPVSERQEKQAILTLLGLIGKR
jgi:hypothetical protein